MSVAVYNKKDLTLLGIFICLIAASFYSYEFILRSTPSIMAHDLMAYYHAPAAAIGILSSCYYLSYVPLQLPAGILMDKYSPKRLLYISVLLCTFGAIISGFATRLMLANIAQIIIGAGSAFAFVGALRLAINWLPLYYFGIFAGFTTMLGMIGAISTDVMLISLVNNIGWKNLWYLLGLIGIFISLLLLIFVKDEPSNNENKLIINSKKQTWVEFWSVIKTLFKMRIFWINGFIGGILFLPITALGTLWGITFLLDSYSLSSTKAGLAISMIFMGMAVGAPMAGWCAKRIFEILSMIKLSCLVSGIILTAIIFSSSYSYNSICILLFMLGFSLGPQVLVFSLARDLIDIRYSGTCVAATNFILTMLSIGIQPLIGYLLDFSWNGALTPDGRHLLTFIDFQFALSALPILCLLAYILCFYIRD